VRDGREIRFMFLPDGEDPDSYIRKIGKEAFELEIKQSQSFSEYLFKQLTDEADVIGIGGRAKLVQTAYPMLSKMQESAYRNQMFEQLKKLGREEELPELPSSKPCSRQKSTRQTKSSMTPVRKAITYLLHQPNIAKSWNEADKNTEVLEKLDLPGMDLLLEVLEILRINPDLSTSALIERWRESPSGSHLAKLASKQPELDDLEVEFIAIMDGLIKKSVDLRYDDLQAKLDQRKLNDSEMDEYKMLLQQIYVAKSASKPD
jgi:DNA primase